MAFTEMQVIINDAFQNATTNGNGIYHNISELHNYVSNFTFQQFISKQLVCLQVFMHFDINKPTYRNKLTEHL